MDGLEMTEKGGKFLYHFALNSRRTHIFNGLLYGIRISFLSSSPTPNHSHCRFIVTLTFGFVMLLTLRHHR